VESKMSNSNNSAGKLNRPNYDTMRNCHNYAYLISFDMIVDMHPIVVNNT